MTTRRFLAAVACAAALAGCGEPVQDVKLRWSFGQPGVGCSAGGVQTVHVFIGPLAPIGSYDHELRCEVGEQGVRLQGVSPGPHVLVLKGLARDKVLFTLHQEVVVPEGDGADLGELVLAPYQPPP